MIIPAMSSSEAKARVDEHYGKVAQRWRERVTGSPFMVQLMEGSLPRAALRTFFKNWASYTIEINTVEAASYHRHIAFFRRNRDLMAPMARKLADELLHPEPPGHIHVVLETAKALGIEEDEVYLEPMLAEFRAKIDFKRAILWEGTVAEFYAAGATGNRPDTGPPTASRPSPPTTASPPKRPSTSPPTRKPTSRSTRTASWATAASAAWCCSACWRAASRSAPATTSAIAGAPPWTSTATSSTPAWRRKAEVRARHRESIHFDEVLSLQLHDNTKAWDILPDGTSARIPRNGETAVRSQEGTYSALGSPPDANRALED